jgi:hypothetical protein
MDVIRVGPCVVQVTKHRSLCQLAQTAASLERIWAEFGVILNVAVGGISIKMIVWGGKGPEHRMILIDMR